MTCLICAGPAQVITCMGSWEERHCQECGHYRMSDALVLMLMEQGQIFNVDKARIWLTDRRLTETLPCIKSVEGLLLL